MSKRTRFQTLKVSDEEKAALAERARAEGTTVSALVRSLATPVAKTAATPAAPTALPIFNVDDLGHDPWRRDNGALKR